MAASTNEPEHNSLGPMGVAAGSLPEACVCLSFLHLMTPHRDSCPITACMCLAWVTELHCSHGAGKSCSTYQGLTKSSPNKDFS